jgi:hypothetical protein
MTLMSSSYLLPKFTTVPFTIELISGISTMVNGTVLNFGKRYTANIYDHITMELQPFIVVVRRFTVDINYSAKYGSFLYKIA